MLSEVAENNDPMIVRTALRGALTAALTLRSPRWLVDLLAGSVGELAGLALHEADPEAPVVLERARSALRVWESYRRSQGIVESF